MASHWRHCARSDRPSIRFEPKTARTAELNTNTQSPYHHKVEVGGAIGERDISPQRCLQLELCLLGEN